MAEFQHLARAPILEAMLNFQANASEHWTEAAPQLKNIWPSHTDIQQLRQLQFQFGPVSAGTPEQTFSTAQVGLMFRSSNEPTVHQARPDGYTFSRLVPYEDWEHFESAAIAGWTAYANLLRPASLHTVMVRFLNRLEFPISGFKLNRYFTTAPKAPPNWAFHGFNQHSVYAVPDSPCMVHSTFATAFSNSPTEKLAFILDIQVTLKEPLTVSGLNLNASLVEMHKRKNEAFFGALTDAALAPYI